MEVHKEVNKTTKQAEVMAFPTILLLMFIILRIKNLSANASGYIEKKSPH